MKPPLTAAERLQQGDWLDRLPPSPIDEAIERHRERFGYPPGVWDFWHTGRFDELAAAIMMAVESGTPFDENALKTAWGLSTGPTPPGFCT